MTSRAMTSRAPVSCRPRVIGRDAMSQRPCHVPPVISALRVRDILLTARQSSSTATTSTAAFHGRDEAELPARVGGGTRPAVSTSDESRTQYTQHSADELSPCDILGNESVPRIIINDATNLLVSLKLQSAFW